MSEQQVAGESLFDELDDLDRRIIEILKHDARKTYAQIGEELGVVRQTIKNRVNALEKRGIIKGYTVITDMTGDEESFMFFLEIEGYPEYFEELAKRLAEEKFIKRLYQITGHCKLHAVGTATNLRSLKVYVDHMRKSLMGIKDIDFSVAVSTLKNVDRNQ